MRISQYFGTILVNLNFNVLIKGFLTKKGARGEQRGGANTENFPAFVLKLFSLEHGSMIERSFQNVDWLMRSLTRKCCRHMRSGMFNIACMSFVLLLARWTNQNRPTEDEGVDYA